MINTFKRNENLVYGNKSIDNKRKRVDRIATKLKEILSFYFIFLKLKVLKNE